MACAPILHMACVLPRIDSGAAFPTHRQPTGHATAHGKAQQPTAAAVAKASAATLRARSETVNNNNNNTDIGGASGGFFNEAEAGACLGLPQVNGCAPA